MLGQRVGPFTVGDTTVVRVAVDADLARAAPMEVLLEEVVGTYDAGVFEVSVRVPEGTGLTGTRRTFGLYGLRRASPTGGLRLSVEVDRVSDDAMEEPLVLAVKMDLDPHRAGPTGQSISVGRIVVVGRRSPG